VQSPEEVGASDLAHGDRPPPEILVEPSHSGQRGLGPLRRVIPLDHAKSGGLRIDVRLDFEAGVDFQGRRLPAVLSALNLVPSSAARLIDLARVDAVYRGFPPSGSIEVMNGAERSSRRSDAAGRIFTVATKLFIGNLDYSTSESELEALCAQHGNVATANIVLDRMTGRSRGFGFVAYESADDAQRAISSLDGTQLNGRQISVSLARERDGSRSAGAGPSGGRRGRW